jgi:hypothetical protein
LVGWTMHTYMIMYSTQVWGTHVHFFLI